MTLAAIAAEGGAELPVAAAVSRMVRAAAPLARADRSDVTVFHDDLDLDDLSMTRAGACFVAPRHLEHVPPATVALVTNRPRDAFQRVAALLHPGSLRPMSAIGQQARHAGAMIHPDAQLEYDVVIDPGAVVGPGVEVGSGTFVGAHSILAAGVRVGRDCAIDAGVSIDHALIGDRVVIHAGTRVGAGGPAREMRREREALLGRVIIQNDVEIGANSVIERGRAEDTVVGEGSSIGALVVVEGGTTVDRRARLRRA